MTGTNDNVSGTTPSSVTTQTLRNGGVPGLSSAAGMPLFNENKFLISEEASELMDVVPELVVVNTNNSSIETNDTYNINGKKLSLQRFYFLKFFFKVNKIILKTLIFSHRRYSRRFSSMDDCKRKKTPFGNANNASRSQKRWKAGNLMFSRLSLRRPK